MGLTDFLTQPLQFGAWAEKWHEPILYRIRLRGDFASRTLLALSAWGIATGLMLVVLAFNVNKTSVPLAIGLGAVFGLAPAALLLFFRRQHTSGTVWLYDDYLKLHHMHAGFPLLVVCTREWPYEAIEHCALVSSEQLGRGFHVLLAVVEGRQEMIGVPPSVDLHALVAFLNQRGVAVAAATSLPPQFRSRLHPVVALFACCVAAAVFLAGLATYLVVDAARDASQSMSDHLTAVVASPPTGTASSVLLPVPRQRRVAAGVDFAPEMLTAITRNACPLS